MSQDQTEQDRTFWTGDRDNYKEHQARYLEALGYVEEPSARAIAAAIRAGFAELAVEISSIRGFGVDQAAKRKT